jgi:hypothetical protein
MPRVAPWRDGAECPFERAGIYRVEDGELIPLAEQAFQTCGGRALDITEDVFAPFFIEAAARCDAIAKTGS